MPRKAKLTGKVFGRLTVICKSGKDKGGNIIWECLCDCGNTSFVNTNCLNTGNTKSCGCLQKEYMVKHYTTHGNSKNGILTPTYRTWLDMKQRCTNPKNHKYSSYGARGITIHPLWLESFETFLSDVGERPSEHFSLDRIDNDKGYEPGNVRWTTKKVQANNKRNTRYLTLKGVKLCLQDWGKKTGINPNTLKDRKKAGWSDEKTLTTPVGKQGK